MNKIIIDNNLFNLENYEGIVVILNKKTNLNIKGKCKLFLINDLCENINIVLFDKSFLDLEIYNNDLNVNRMINITQNNNTIVNFKDIIMSKSNITEKVISNIIGNKNETNITINAYSDLNKITILEQINALENTIDNIATERVNGLCDGGYINVLPNMEIATCNIEANHFVTISSYNKDDLFYLNSKGISDDFAKSLIKKSFLLGILNEKIRKEIDYE